LAARSEEPREIPITPQRRRQTARKRLPERTNAVCARVLEDLGLGRNGREVARTMGKGTDANVRVVTRMLHAEVNDFLGIGRGSRKEMSREQAERAFDELDALGDKVRERIEDQMGGHRRGEG
jgi:DNA repair protein RadD